MDKLGIGGTGKSSIVSHINHIYPLHRKGYPRPSDYEQQFTLSALYVKEMWPRNAKQQNADSIQLILEFHKAFLNRPDKDTFTSTMDAIAQALLDIHNMSERLNCTSNAQPSKVLLPKEYQHARSGLHMLALVDELDMHRMATMLKRSRVEPSKWTK